jgi:hypothetical protein
MQTIIARTAGRSLLVLDTRSGDIELAIYRNMQRHPMGIWIKRFFIIKEI